MNKSIEDKIKESIKDLEDIGGLKNPNMKKVIVKLKKAVRVNKKSKK